MCSASSINQAVNWHYAIQTFTTITASSQNASEICFLLYIFKTTIKPSSTVASPVLPTLYIYYSLTQLTFRQSNNNSTTNQTSNISPKSPLSCVHAYYVYCSANKLMKPKPHRRPMIKPTFESFTIFLIHFIVAHHLWLTHHTNSDCFLSVCRRKREKEKEYFFER